MHALIIGGSGRTGKLVIKELLRRGHEVTALVRDPAAMEGLTNVNTVQGSPTQLSDVRKAFHTRIPDVVIVTLNAPRASDSPFAAPISPPRLMADSNANVVTAMKEFGVQKVIIMQAFGVGASWPNMSCLLRGLMSKSNMSYQYDDHNMTAKEVRASGVTYVMVRPSRLVESDVTAVREWPSDGKGVPLMGSTSRKSVACFLVDAAEESRWDNTAPVITN
ncbi:uncharacterized protein N7496_009729 [Penicillium cataractarum]|uniref:NAD(P)-binding domain-containing protein n=1 Tax=Penicillium cataractarum TaxID=2100454 RepID=A0A9W9V2Q7_9EURO|nr:uncharacterized protein N7496_009729 [Penicillium cataractarum]KAJ5364016.1 hypothetical protein N7496_009729 [Penicillium cataractarum]